MPALPPVNKVLRFTLRGLFGEDTDIINRWFMQYGGTAPTDTDLNNLAAAVLTEWAANMAAKVMAGYATQGVTIEDLTSSTAAVGLAVGTHAGTDTGVTLGAATSAVIQLKIARRYRGGHPRQYIAGISNAHLTTDQKWDATFATALANAFISWMNAITTHIWSGGTSLTSVNVSYYEGFHNFTFPSGRTRPIPTLRGTPLVDGVFNWEVNPRPGSQRRRNLQGQ